MMWDEFYRKGFPILRSMGHLWRIIILVIIVDSPNMSCCDHFFSSKTLKQSNWKIYQAWQCSANIIFCGYIFLLENSKSIKTKMRLLEALKLILLFFLSAGETMSSVTIFDSLGACYHNVLTLFPPEGL